MTRAKGHTGLLRALRTARRGRACARSPARSRRQAVEWEPGSGSVRARRGQARTGSRPPARSIPGLAAIEIARSMVYLDGTGVGGNLLTLAFWGLVGLVLNRFVVDPWLARDRAKPHAPWDPRTDQRPAPRAPKAESPRTRSALPSASHSAVPSERCPGPGTWRGLGRSRLSGRGDRLIAPRKERGPRRS